MERLAKSCRQLVWLNPLLRYEKFEARPAGVRAMLPHVIFSCRCIISRANLASTQAPHKGETPVEMTGEQLIPASQQDTWNALNDPEVLKACVPGCESIAG